MPRASANRRVQASSLTREEVIDAAADIVAEGGYEALNMRALAERCDAAVTTIYRLISDKDELMAVLADRLMGTTLLDPAAPADDDWERELLEIFTGAHATLAAHPELVEIMARQHTNGRVGVVAAERTIRALERAGLDGELAATAFNVLVAYIHGFTLRQLNSTAASAGERWAMIQDLPEPEYPKVHAYAKTLSTRPSDSQFEQGLRAIIHGFVGAPR